MKKSLYEVSVFVNKREISEYNLEEKSNTKGYQPSSFKTYVEGRSGSEFELKLTNNSGQTVLMIPSVDGLSVIDGKPANENSKGYIVGPYSNIIIPGWTLDDNTVAKFIFADKKKSYAANHPDEPSEKNVGVIGVLVWSAKKDNFQEQIDKMMEEIKKQKKDTVYIPTPWIYPVYPSYPSNPYPYWCGTLTCNNIPTSYSFSEGKSPDNAISGVANVYQCSTLASASNCSADAGNATLSCNILRSSVNDSFELGTGFGKEKEFKTITEKFEKDSIVATLVLYYDSRKNLEKMGIIISKTKKETKVDPNPFPAMTGCKPPVDWKK